MCWRDVPITFFQQNFVTQEFFVHWVPLSSTGSTTFVSKFSKRSERRGMGGSGMEKLSMHNGTAPIISHTLLILSETQSGTSEHFVAGVSRKL